MAAPMNVSLPPFFVLANNYVVRLSAQDPASGAEIGAVVVSNASLAVDQGEPDTPTQAVPLSPAYLPA